MKYSFRKKYLQNNNFYFDRIFCEPFYAQFLKYLLYYI